MGVSNSPTRITQPTMVPRLISSPVSRLRINALPIQRQRVAVLRHHRIACRWLPPPDRSVSPRQSRTPLTASPAQSPIAPASLHQNPCPLRSFASGKELPPGHYSCPVLVTDSPRSVPLRPEHRRQHLRSQLPFVSSDNDSEYSALLRACGKTRSPPSRSQQTLPPSAGSPMHCDADAAPEPALRSCQHFTTTARNKTGALLSRLHSNKASSFQFPCRLWMISSSVA